MGGRKLCHELHGAMASLGISRGRDTFPTMACSTPLGPASIAYRLQTVGMHPGKGLVGNCYENALDERVFGILKGEYGLDHLFLDRHQAALAVREAVWLYNHERPHLSLDYRKPAEVFFQL